LWLNLLNRLARRIVVPVAVYTEIEAGKSKDESAAVTLDWAKDFRIADLAALSSVASWELGSGETQVLSHGVVLSGTVAPDDLMARRCARAHGLDVLGTLGTCLRAKRLGIIPSARPIVEQLRHCGMFMDEHLFQHALAEVGE
jgi:predicted nucleic acid-binding protein